MNAAVKKQWVAALRSNHYKQGQYVLRNIKDEFCCLGVLCNIYDPTQWDSQPSHGAYDYHYKSTEGRTDLPQEMIQDLNLSCYQTDHLADMNDTGSSFSDIADYIEAIY